MIEKTSITVSIDLTDEHEKALFDYVMKKGPRKKSGYIKRLIHADMVGITKKELTTTTFAEDEIDDDDRQAMFDAL